MSKLVKIGCDLTVVAAVYGGWLFRKWSRKGRRVFVANTLLYLYLTAVVGVTLMPVIVNLPFCLNHPYTPMNWVPFEDALHRRGDFVRQIVLNVMMTVPFGLLFPLCRRAYGKSCRCILCVAVTALGSFAIEWVQPLINGARSADITDVLTNTTGGLIGYLLYAWLRLIVRRMKGNSALPSDRKK